MIVIVQSKFQLCCSHKMSVVTFYSTLWSQYTAKSCSVHYIRIGKSKDNTLPFCGGLRHLKTIITGKNQTAV